MLFPPPRNLPGPGIEPESLASLALAGRFFIASATWEAPFNYYGRRISQTLDTPQ